MPRSELIQSITRALEVLEVLAGASEGMSPKQLANMLKLNRSTVYNIVRTLAARGYVQATEDRGRYSLGPGIATLLELQSQRSILARAVEALKRLRERQPKLSVVFSQPIDGAMHTLARIENFRPNFVQRPHIEVMHPYAKASSLTLQAFANETTVAELRQRYPFAEYGRPYWDSLEALDQFLVEARKLGHIMTTVNDGQISVIVAPVFDPVHRFIGAIGAFRLGQLTEAESQSALDAVLTTATEFKASLGRASRRASSA